MNKRATKAANQHEATKKRTLALKKEQVKVISSSDLELIAGGVCEIGTCAPGTWV